MTVRVAATKLDLRWQKILALRGYLWAGLDLSRSLAAVHRMRPGMAEYPNGSAHRNWDPPSDIPFPTGTLHQLSTHASLEEQWEWLQRIKPAYLYTRPSFLRGYAQLARHGNFRFEKILTTGEVVDQNLRSLALEKLGATIHDRYASQEAGCFAIQCPDTTTYHVQSETIIIELLNDEGAPCQEGEIGRVVVTPLFNFAAPLLRYEIGDYAEAGGACTCGRSLPTLKRIMGRRRNMLVGRDGRHYWPQLHGFDFYKVSQCREHQFRQVAPDVIEMWLVVDNPRTDAQEEEMRKIVTAALPVPFEIRFRYVDEFPRGPSDKHEELISFVADPLRGRTA
jgi:phenylacetate-CoA ligase